LARSAEPALHARHLAVKRGPARGCKRGSGEPERAHERQALAVGGEPAAEREPAAQEHRGAETHGEHDAGKGQQVRPEVRADAAAGGDLAEHGDDTDQEAPDEPGGLEAAVDPRSPRRSPCPPPPSPSRRLPPRRRLPARCSAARAATPAQAYAGSPRCPQDGGGVASAASLRDARSAWTAVMRPSASTSTRSAYPGATSAGRPLSIRQPNGPRHAAWRCTRFT